MNLAKASAKYEAWLGGRLRLLQDDLAYKHDQMRLAPFPFLRATYYRWAQIWPEACGAAARGPDVLAVGDLHVENFGTWRDSEGRLIWGISDFDEAWRMPYTNDLIRLTTSAMLAGMACSGREAASAILGGYSGALEARGRPFALAEHHPALRSMATARLHEPEQFWDKLKDCPDAEDVPSSAMKAMSQTMPDDARQWRVVHRRAGLGSLGRPRYVALAEWHGGLIAREAKATAPSGCAWAEKEKVSEPSRSQEAIDRAVRCRDPFVRIQERWIIRRLAPDCSRIELSALPKQRDEKRLLYAMGWETANVHLGSARARTLLADVKERPHSWLLEAARKMEKAVRADFVSQ